MVFDTKQAKQTRVWKELKKIFCKDTKQSDFFKRKTEEQSPLSTCSGHSRTSVQIPAPSGLLCTQPGMVWMAQRHLACSGHWGPSTHLTVGPGGGPLPGAGSPRNGTSLESAYGDGFSNSHKSGVSLIRNAWDQNILDFDFDFFFLFCSTCKYTAWGLNPYLNMKFVLFHRHLIHIAEGNFISYFK